MELLPQTPIGLTPYWAARWYCPKCGKFLAGSRNPPPQSSRCPHCKSPTLLEALCQGFTARPLPFADKPSTNFFGKNERPYWQQQPTRRIHRKGYKRPKGAKDKLNGYTQSQHLED